MLKPADPLDDASIGALLSRLADDGKRLASAEIAIRVETVKGRVAGLKTAAALIVVALLLVVAAVVVLVGGLAAWLARWLGPLGGGAAAAVIALVLAGLLGWLAARSVSAVFAEPAG